MYNFVCCLGFLVLLSSRINNNDDIDYLILVRKGGGYSGML